MAGPVEVLSMHPHALDTPPRTPYKGVDSLNSGKESPRKVIGKFPTDSSLGDVFYDPSPTSVSSPRPRDDSNQEIMPEDPFDSQHNRILFDAIDALQSFGAGDLSIPQVCNLRTFGLLQYLQVIAHHCGRTILWKVVSPPKLDWNPFPGR
jgi:hypothetical protein